MAAVVEKSPNPISMITLFNPLTIRSQTSAVVSCARVILLDLRDIKKQETFVAAFFSFVVLVVLVVFSGATVIYLITVSLSSFEER